MCAQSCLTLCKSTPRTEACQAPLSMEFLKQEYWSRLPFPSPGDLPNPGIEATSLESPTLAYGFFTTRTSWKALHNLGDWNAKGKSQELSTIIHTFGLGIQNEAEQRLKEFCQGNTLVIANTFSNTRDDSIHGHHQMINTRIRLITFSAAEDREALYSQQKQDLELTGSDHELLIAKFRLKLKKVGETTIPKANPL